MSEQVLTRAIVDALNRLGCYVWRVNVVRRGHVLSVPQGTPDVLGVARGGRMIAIEVKVGNGKTTAEQDKVLEKLGSMGALHGVARSVEDAVAIALQTMRKEND